MPDDEPGSGPPIEAIAREVVAADPAVNPKSGKTGGLPAGRSLTKIGAIIVAAGIGVAAVGGGVYLATHGSSKSPPPTSQGSTGAHAPGVNIPIDPAQAIHELLLHSVPPTISVHHDKKIVRGNDVQWTRYVDTYSLNPLADYSTGTEADGNPVSAVTNADGTTCSTFQGKTNVFKSLALTQYNNYGAWGRLYALKENLKFEPDGPGPIGDLAHHTYGRIIGDGPPFANQPQGRTVQVNTIEVFFDRQTGMIAAVVEYTKFTDANGMVTEQTETRYDPNYKPDVNIPKCP
jgi:hypothetical protein